MYLADLSPAMTFVTAELYLGRSAGFRRETNHMCELACTHQFHFLCLLENIHFALFVFADSGRAPEIRDELQQS